MLNFQTIASNIRPIYYIEGGIYRPERMPSLALPQILYCNIQNINTYKYSIRWVRAYIRGRTFCLFRMGYGCVALCHTNTHNSSEYELWCSCFDQINIGMLLLLGKTIELYVRTMKAYTSEYSENSSGDWTQINWESLFEHKTNLGRGWKWSASRVEVAGGGGLVWLFVTYIQFCNHIFLTRYTPKTSTQ